MLNKKQVEKYLEKAPSALQVCGIVEPDGTIKKTFRGQISSFGAAVSMGSFKCAVAFFSDQGGASVERHNLIKALDYICNDRQIPRAAAEICRDICEPSSRTELSRKKEQYLSASLAIKMAMNAYHLTGD